MGEGRRHSGFSYGKKSILHTINLHIHPLPRDSLEARLECKELRQNGRKHEGISHSYGIVCDGC